MGDGVYVHGPAILSQPPREDHHVAGPSQDHDYRHEPDGPPQSCTLHPRAAVLHCHGSAQSGDAPPSPAPSTAPATTPPASATPPASTPPAASAAAADPGPGYGLQPPGFPAEPPAAGRPGGAPEPSQPLTSQQQHQQKMRLQRIQLERERIRMRQEELMRQCGSGTLVTAVGFPQEVALCRQMPIDSENMAAGPTPINTAPLTQGTMPNHNSDPFLNSGPYHSREQSTDSGLGLGCYSIPTTPEDILNNVEEMDTGEGLAQGTLGVPQQSRFPDFLDSLPGTNVDLGTLEGADLIPILNDVESVLNKAEPYLTWL
ncbi:hypothetical protein ANANG_G00123780 [Anguilla anguilla]|uniref:WW domain-containing protein n=1 Tax=Anguilla anguilla TaxID=7936 RepID=A0A9D3RXU5_ANGAN|nr:hypothetical protein ANANG_G00123780 [Anguilla anguilla]